MWLALPALFTLVKKENIDLMHAHTRVTQVMAALVSASTKIPYVSTCHGFFKPHLFRRIFLCWGKATIAISRAVHAHLIKDFHLDPLHVTLITSGIDLTEFKPVSKEQQHCKRQEWGADGDPMLGIIARLSSVKGIDVLIDAMPLVKLKFP